MTAKAAVMPRWPWVTIAVAALLALNPLGRDVLYSAFLSGEGLARNISRPIVLIITLILIGLGLLEWWIWKKINSKPNFPSSTQAPTSDAVDTGKTET